MASSRSRNLAELRRLAAPITGPLAVKAVRAGLAVIEAGLRQRCPAGAARAILPTIRRTRIGRSARAVGGGVVVGAPRALAVEFGKHPFVRPTRMLDGPRAEKAMEGVLKGGIS